MEPYERREQERVALQLWIKLHEEYQTLEDKYQGLLKEKKRLDIKPLNALPTVSIWKKLPKSELLAMDCEETVKEYLQSLTDGDLFRTISKATWYRESCERQIIKARIVDFSYQIKYHEKRRKNSYWGSPNGGSCGREIHGHNVLRDE